MARRAIGARRARFKLTGVWIRVAILAALVVDCTMKVAVAMTLGAGKLLVRLHQGKLRQAVFEVPAWTVLLPTARVVARSASAAELGRLKRTAMWIGVAVLATGKYDSRIGRSLLTSFRHMAFEALYGLVQTGQGKSGFSMIESSGRFPCVLIVATQAVGTQTAAVRLHMAS